MIRSVLLRKWIAWTLLALAILCVSTWYLTREKLPPTIRIATAAQGGLYYKFGQILGKHLERSTGRPIQLIETKGSVENRELLVNGQADLAILQAGTVPLEHITALAPLFHDVVQVVVRKGREIHSPRDLAGKRVSLGPTGSGMRESAVQVLGHYSITPNDLRDTELFFDSLKTNSALDAAVVTTGLLNPDLRQLLSSGEFEILPILDAEALATHFPFFSPKNIPRGLYAEGPPVPSESLPTVATTAFLAARDDTTTILVISALTSLYENYPKYEIPTLISKKEAADWASVPIHREARSYFEPYEGLGILSNFMQSLAAFKELVFATIAVAYLAWDRWRRLKEKEGQLEVRQQKEHLDTFLNETVRIEEAQMKTDDAKVLRMYLDEITLIKLKALKELTHEDLRGDRMFTIFLAQCANLIQKIQNKILLKAELESGQPRALSASIPAPATPPTEKD